MSKWLLLAGVLCTPWAHGAQSALFNAEGLRADRYRAPLPSSVPGAKTINSVDLQELIVKKSELALVDVQAITMRPETADFDLDWLPSSVRYHIPDSVWLPNVGYGELSHQMQAFFEREMAAVTDGDKNRPVVFYCVADCWMSWNTVQRAGSLGYTQLYWFPQGTDGWEEQGFPLVEATPQPLNRTE